MSQSKRNPFYLSKHHHYYLVYKSLRIKSGRALDYGCGNGRFIGQLSGKFKKLYGYDVDDTKITQGKKMYKHVIFKKGEIDAKLPYKDNYFDCLFLLAVLEHVDDEERVIDECYRVLKKNGKFFLYLAYKGLFEWADLANVRYRFPKIHEILYKRYWGDEEYKQKFQSINSRKMYGDSSLSNNWHKHYDQKEILRLLGEKFEIKEFKRYALFMPFLLFLHNFLEHVMKIKELSLIDKFIWWDAHLSPGKYSYCVFVIAKKK